MAFGYGGQCLFTTFNFWDFMKLLLCYLKSMNYCKQQRTKSHRWLWREAFLGITLCQTALKVVLLFPMIPRNATLLLFRLGKAHEQGHYQNWAVARDPVFFFSSFFGIFWCMQTGDHWEEDLAKFDCRPDMKVKNI